jgi:hypothetical protein
MAEVSRQEFAELCGDDVKTLNVYISRKKLIVSADGKTIDTTNPVNKSFKDKRKAANQAKMQAAAIIAGIPPNPLAPGPQAGRKRPNEDEDGGEPLPEPLDIEKITALFQGNKGGRRDRADGEELGDMQKYVMMKIKGDAELVTIRVEKEQLLLDKSAGKLLPMDLALDVLKNHGKIFLSNFENSINNIATVFCEVMAGGDMDMYTRIVSECRRELSAAITRAGSEAKLDLQSILDEYAESKGNKL